MRVKLVPPGGHEDTGSEATESGAGGITRWRFRGGAHGSARVAGLLAVVLIGARIAAVPITLSQDATYRPHAPLTGDVRRFHSIASSHHGTPYRDFPVEYPPVMLGAIELLGSSTTHAATVATMWSQLVLDLFVAGTILWGWGRRAALAYLVIGFPLICYPFLYLRLDLLSVALAVAALALVRRRHPVLGGLALAVAVFSKLWPVLLVPGLVVRRSWRAVASFTVLGGAGLVAWVAWVDTDGPIQVVSMRNATGFEIESTVGAIIRVMSNEAVHYNEGAFRVAHVREWAIILSAVVLAVAVIAAWVLAARAVEPAKMFDGTAALAAVGVFLATAPLLSPQFSIWLVPFAAIAVAYGDRLIGGLTLLVVALSVIDFAQIDSYANTNAVAPQVVVLVRNATLVALVVVCFVRLARASAPGGRGCTRGHGRGMSRRTAVAASRPVGSRASRIGRLLWLALAGVAVAAAVGGLVIPLAAAQATPTGTTRWTRFLHVPAVVDLTGPRTDGSLTVAADGRLFRLRPGSAPVPFAGGYTTAKGPEPYRRSRRVRPPMVPAARSARTASTPSNRRPIPG